MYNRIKKLKKLPRPNNGQYKVKVKQSRNRPWRPIGLFDVKDATLLENRLADGGKVVCPTHPPYFTPQKQYYFYVSGTHFC
jgi:hypothetical protein